MAKKLEFKHVERLDLEAKDVPMENCPDPDPVDFNEVRFII